jgi:hypothetical protein
MEKTFSSYGDIYTKTRYGTRSMNGPDDWFYYINGRFVGKVTKSQAKNIISYARGKHEIVYGVNNFNVIMERA